VAKEEGNFDFTEGDALMELARRHSLKVNGHTLVWHQRCPDWFFLEDGQPASREPALERMRNHIATVAGRYAGRIATWDVVNEALSDGPGYLRESKWLATIGNDYVEQAFVAAHQADPAARLYYNDYHIEAGAKRENALRLLRELKAKGIPVHGIGIQGHWQLDSVPYKEIAEAIDLFHAEGLEVAITELDIDVVTRKTTGADSAHKEAPRKDPFPDGLPPEISRRLAEQYARLFTLLQGKSDKLVRVTFWGLHDGNSWLNEWPTARTNHPLLWDRQLRPKPDYHAVIEAAPRATSKN
jgi:endo-1,4-beta-xylanase